MISSSWENRAVIVSQWSHLMSLLDLLEKNHHGRTVLLLWASRCRKRETAADCRANRTGDTSRDCGAEHEHKDCHVTSQVRGMLAQASCWSLRHTHALARTNTSVSQQCCWDDSRKVIYYWQLITPRKNNLITSLTSLFHMQSITCDQQKKIYKVTFGITLLKYKVFQIFPLSS